MHTRGLGRRGKVSRSDALKDCRKIEAELNRGRIVDGKAPTIEDYGSRFLWQNPGYAEGTQYLYRLTIRSLVACFGKSHPIDRITRADAADWRAALAAGELAEASSRNCGAPSESTVCRYTIQAKNIFQTACREGVLAFNPFLALVASAPEPDKTWSYIDRRTLKNLMDACPDDSWRLLFALCRLAGLRRGEALRLKWTEIDWEARRLKVVNPLRYKSTKKRSREVPLEPELYDLLFEVYMKPGKGAAQVVDLAAKYRRNLSRSFWRITERAGIEPWSQWCHTLRKNREAEWLETIPLHVVAAWLGHAPEVAMRHYLRPEQRHYDMVTRDLAPAKPGGSAGSDKGQRSPIPSPRPGEAE